MPDSNRLLLEESQHLCRATWHHIQQIRGETERLKTLLEASEQALIQSRDLLDGLAKTSARLPRLQAPQEHSLEQPER